jgi:ABC-2 type transport system permease protein
LTLPATDVEIVLGKYLAAVAIYSVSLVFSMFSIYLVFSYGLGTPDRGLFIGTFVGYWFIGLAMLAIGMVASFLTSNLTVGFVMGMVFNAPMALFGVADWFVRSPTFAQAIKNWSAAAQFRDFERGVISLAGMSYFVMIAAVMLYLSMVLIGRRHWSGREGGAMWAHYLARTIGLVALAVGINLFLSNHNSLRADITSEKLNSLADGTRTLVRELRDSDKAKTIKIDAYVSPQVPAEYAQHKLNFLSTLAELKSLSGGKIQVEVHEIENFSPAATQANESYGIAPKEVATISRGVRASEEIILGAAFNSGLNRVVIPFIDKGIPVEYELVRSIATVADQDRKKLGVLSTDAQLMGGFSMSMQGMAEESRIITELKKQYDVVEVDPTRPITEKYDVLLAVQPSSLSPDAMANFVDAVRAGQPTAIFEDPYPRLFNVVGTLQPKPPAGGPMASMFGGGQSMPKGDISQLWQLLGVDLPGDKIIWQNFNPVAKFSGIPQEWVFIDEALASQGVSPFHPEDAISAGMKQVLFLLPGAWQSEHDSKLTFTPLAVTGRNTGTINFFDIMQAQESMMPIRPQKDVTQQAYVIAAHVTGKARSEGSMFLSRDGAANGDSGDDEDVKKAPVETDINVVLVADIDWIAPVIFELRERGNDADMLVDWQFQNVSFVLNVLDALAGDDRFLPIRKRTRAHRILTKIEEATEENRRQSIKQQEDFKLEAEQQIAAAQQRFQEKIDEVERRPDLDPRVREQMLREVQTIEQRALDVRVAALEKDRNAKIKQSERELTAEIRAVQDNYKRLAVILPPIPPLLLGLAVFFHRRKAEHEGVDVRRLRWGKPADSAPPE